MAAHVVRLTTKPHTGRMRKLSLRILVAVITLTIGVSSGWLLHRLRQPRPAPLEPAPCPTPTPSAAPQCVPVSYEDKDDNPEYPDDAELSPWDIFQFIDVHPQAKLKKLWKRLRVKEADNNVSDFSECSNCAVTTESFDLDNEPGDETLLKISDVTMESYRYLIFKYTGPNNVWRFIGYVDEWGKYRESESHVVVSGGKTWLVTMGQSASGSGVAYYHNRVFEVTKNRLKEVASYESEGYQAGWGRYIDKEFTTRILDIQKVQNQTRVKVEFNLDYGLNEEKDIPLFSKRQVAVFVSAKKSEQTLDATESTVTQRELEHIYTVDSMTEHDFLKYNLSELLNLAERGTKAQKNWLREFLERCDTSAEKRQLRAALAK